MLVTQPIFLTTNNKVVNYFNDPKEKKYLHEILVGMDKLKLNKEADLLNTTKPSHYQFAYEEYNKNYTTLNNLAAQVLLTKTPTESNAISQDIAKTLFLHEPKKNLFFVLWKFIVFMGGIPTLLFFVILTSGIFVNILRNKNRELSYEQLFVALFVIITYMNSAVIAVFQMNSAPYFCYTQFLFYCFAAYITDRIFLILRVIPEI